MWKIKWKDLRVVDGIQYEGWCKKKKKVLQRLNQNSTSRKRMQSTGSKTTNSSPHSVLLAELNVPNTPSFLFFLFDCGKIHLKFTTLTILKNAHFSGVKYIHTLTRLFILWAWNSVLHCVTWNYSDSPSPPFLSPPFNTPWKPLSCFFVFWFFFYNLSSS